MNATLIDSQSVALTGLTGGAIYGMAELVGGVLHVEPPQAALGLCLLAAVSVAPEQWWRSVRQIITTLFAALALLVTAYGANRADVKLQQGEALLARPADAQEAPPPPTPPIWEPRRPW